MNRVEKQVLKNKAGVITGSLDPKDLHDHLIGSNIINETELQLILAEPTRTGRNQRFIRTLKRKRNGYQGLIEILQNSNTSWILRPLEDERKRLEDLGEATDLTNLLDPQKIRTQLSEMQCNELGQFILPEYEEVGMKLGFTRSELVSMTMGRQMNMAMIGYDMLIKWGQKETRNANLEKLLRVFDEVGVDYDEEPIKKEFGRRECSER